MPSGFWRALAVVLATAILMTVSATGFSSRSSADALAAGEPILVWTPSHLPAGFAARVTDLPGVREVTVVTGGTAWLTHSHTTGGAMVDHPSPDMAIPIDVGGISLQSFNRFLPLEDRRFLPALANGEGLLGTREAELRRLGAGAVLSFGSIQVRIAGVVHDADIGWHELLVTAKTAAALGVEAQKYLLIEPTPRADWRGLARQIPVLLPAGEPVRIRGPGEARFLREADAVLPPVLQKAEFGEFALNPHRRVGDRMTVDPQRIGSHIVTEPVPILGRVTCNRRIFPMLRGALAAIASEGLASEIHATAGCFTPRLIAGVAGNSLSHHAWGTAIDINPRRNAYDETPHQDPRVVEIFARWGFTWGGRWLVPDGMHFEYLGPAPQG